MTPSGSALRLPARFHCGASYKWRNSGGELLIAENEVTFTFRPWTPLLGRIPTVTQRSGPVTFVHARLLPPGIDRGLIVRGETGAVQVVTSMGQYTRVREALEAAGIAIEQREAWLSCGARLARKESGRLLGLPG
jgi:hypothetical protein